MSTRYLNKISTHDYKALAAITLPILMTVLLAFSQHASANSQTDLLKVLSFEHAIQHAQRIDPWLTGNIHQQQALESLSVAANTLPDPKVTIGIANIAAVSYDRRYLVNVP